MAAQHGRASVQESRAVSCSKDPCSPLLEEMTWLSRITWRTGYSSPISHAFLKPIVDGVHPARETRVYLQKQQDGSGAAVLMATETRHKSGGCCAPNLFHDFLSRGPGHWCCSLVVSCSHPGSAILNKKGHAKHTRGSKQELNKHIEAQNQIFGVCNFMGQALTLCMARLRVRNVRPWKGKSRDSLMVE